MTIRTAVSWVFLMIAALLAPGAAAETIFWSFNGVADFVDDGLGLLGGSVSTGTAISGTFSFNSLAADRSGEPDIGSYQNRNQQAVLSLEVTFGGHTLIVDPTPKPTAVSSARIDVFNDNSIRYDEWTLTTFELNATLDGAPVDLWFVEISSGLSPRDTSILDSDALPTAPPSFPRYRYFMNLGEVQGTATRINGDVTFLLVPEPASATLLLVGLIAVTCGRRRLTSGWS